MERNNIFSFFLIFIVSVGFVSAGIEFGYDSKELPSVIISGIVSSVGGNITTFLNLTDTPASYTGEGGNCLKVNIGETALEFGSCGAGTGDNETWNESYADTLYADIEWAYNQTIPAIAYADGLVTTYNDTWSSTYNATYDSATGDNVTWNETGARDIFLELDGGNANSNIDIGAYNFTTTGTGLFAFLGSLSEYISILRVFDIEFVGNMNGSGNITTTGNITSPEFCTGGTCGNVSDFLVGGDPDWNKTYADTLYAGIEWAYNQTLATFTNYNSTWDQSYLDIWNYNQSTATYNMYNEGWTTTYNATYDGISAGSGYAPSDINLTAGTQTASLSDGGLTGYASGDYTCNAEFTGSHLCTEFEVALWQGTTLDDDAWVIGGGPKYAPASLPVNDCNGFTHGTAGDYLGNYWHFDSSTKGDGRAINCGTTLKLACCSY